jgi:hypothetical protein
MDKNRSRHQDMIVRKEINGHKYFTHLFFFFNLIDIAYFLSCFEHVHIYMC